MLAAAAEAANIAIPPWWAGYVIGGTFAIAGVLLTLYFNDRRDKRQDARRWERDLRDVSARFAESCQRVARNCMSEVDTDRLRTDEHEKLVHLQELYFLAPSFVVAAAVRTSWAVDALMNITLVDINGTHNSAAIKQAMQHYANLRVEFANEVRKAIGVKPLPLDENF